MVNMRGSNVNQKAAPIPDTTSKRVPAWPRGRPPRAVRARTMPVPMDPRMVWELEDEVDGAPAPLPEPNHLEKTLTDIRTAMNTFVDLMAIQTQQNLQMGIQALQQGGMRAPVVEDMAQLAMKFVRLEPSIFTGTNPTADPQDFLEEVEKATTLLGVKDYRVVRLVVYQLKDIADLWFKGIEKSGPEDAPPMVWAEFKKIFTKKWLPPGVRAALAILFETLKQDTMTVLEYSIKFEKLSRYAPHLIPTEDEKIDRFTRGLISSIRKDTAGGRRNTTFIDFVDLAMDLERIHQEERANREQNKKSHTFGTFILVPSPCKGQSSRGPSGSPQSRVQTTFSSPLVPYSSVHGGQSRTV
uniref:Uncharacterized protein LOC104214889 n=1 Tax=Nicotiana sylvestris TaxID=4096 RepID=A0A1U7VKP4_NICSY|nr:PREDICTED: uncharacterized protein LOC104214889 [Nicotiana sylvestris]